jgi:hypothetical protein
MFSSLPTILDRLSDAGEPSVFLQQYPLPGEVEGVKYIGSSGWLAESLERAAAGTLPAVSFVDPMRYWMTGPAMTIIRTRTGLLLPEDADVNTLGDDFAVHGGQQLGA